VQPHQAVTAGGLRKIAPEHTRTHARAATLDVNVQLAQACGAQQDGISEVTVQRRRAVAGALRNDP